MTKKNTRTNILLVVVIWFCMWMITWPALLASFQGQFANDTSFNERWFRRDLAFAMGISLFPPAWVVTPFVTRFYEHGFQFGRRT